MFGFYHVLSIDPHIQVDSLINCTGVMKPWKEPIKDHNNGENRQSAIRRGKSSFPPRLTLSRRCRQGYLCG